MPKIRNNSYAKLKEKNLSLESFINSISEPLILIDNEFNIMLFNTVTNEFTAKSPEEIQNKKCFQALYERVSICPFCPLQKFIKDLKSKISLDLQNSPINGLYTHTIYKRLNKNRFLDLSFFKAEREGKVFAFVEKISDITKIKEKEEERLRMRNLASLGVLISGVAHELNNPLTGISLTVQNLIKNLSNYNTESIQERLDIIQKDLYRAAFLVSDILSFAKPEKPKFTLADLSEVIQKAKDTAERLTPEISERINWEIKVDMDPIFYFHPLKLERLFLNLFRNSLQAFDYKEGTIWVEAKEKGNSCIVTVEDNAGGIPKDVVDKIFDPFYSKGKGEHGTGLGLSISHSIVKDHKGKIKVISQEDRTKFTISLPMNRNRIRK